jgi:hypothetical protein
LSSPAKLGKREIPSNDAALILFRKLGLIRIRLAILNVEIKKAARPEPGGFSFTKKEESDAEVQT